MGSRGLMLWNVCVRVSCLRLMIWGGGEFKNSQSLNTSEIVFIGPSGGESVILVVVADSGFPGGRGVTYYYRPQWSCDKVMFLQLSVILCTGGGVSVRETPPRQRPRPPVNRMTDASKNITLSQTSFAGGNECFWFLFRFYKISTMWGKNASIWRISYTKSPL